ncbi:unnamed protein product, partial [Didymodactylos carnosus]
MCDEFGILFADLIVKLKDMKSGLVYNPVAIKLLSIVTSAFRESKQYIIPDSRDPKWPWPSILTCKDAVEYHKVGLDGIHLIARPNAVEAVILWPRYIEKKDSPFLNCFEKHMVDIHQLIQPIHWTITRELLAWLSGFLELSTVTTVKHFILIQHMIANFNCHYICNLVIDHYKQDEQESTIKYCKDKFICASSFDFVLMLKLNHQENSSLIQQYHDRKKISFDDIIIDILENKNKNKYGQIIYTYTQIYETIHYPNILDNNIGEVKLANFKSQLELINKVKQYYQPSMQKSLLIICIDYDKEKNHLLLLKR